MKQIEFGNWIWASNVSMFQNPFYLDCNKYKIISLLYCFLADVRHCNWLCFGDLYWTKQINKKVYEHRYDSHSSNLVVSLRISRYLAYHVMYSQTFFSVLVNNLILTTISAGHIFHFIKCKLKNMAQICLRSLKWKSKTGILVCSRKLH